MTPDKIIMKQRLADMHIDMHIERNRLRGLLKRAARFIPAQSESAEAMKAEIAAALAETEPVRERAGGRAECGGEADTCINGRPNRERRNDDGRTGGGRGCRSD